MAAKIAPDYDLVIIGSTPAALRAAVGAAQDQLRVGLVYADAKAAKVAWQQQSLYHYLSTHSRQLAPSPMHLGAALAWSEQIAEQLASKYAPVNLACLGIDVIEGAGVFQHPTELSLAVAERNLKAKTYLLVDLPPTATPNATGAHSGLGHCPAANWLGYLNQQVSISKTFPQAWLVVGGTPAACETAACLQQLGLQVHLATSAPCILSSETASLRQQVQAQLTAMGVQIHTLVQVGEAQSLALENRVRLHPLGTSLKRPLELTCDVIVNFTLAKLPPNWLNLKGMGVQLTTQQIQVNRWLQTNHPQVYACGDLLSGYARPDLSLAEANQVWKNLSQPWQRKPINYLPVTWKIDLFPPILRVGLNEDQAKQQDSKAWVDRQSLAHTDLAQLTGDLTGYTEIIVSGKGKVLGATICGLPNQAKGQALALAIQKGLTWAEVSRFWDEFAAI